LARKPAVPLKMPTHIILGAKRIKLRTGSDDFPDDRYAHYSPTKNEIVVHPTTTGEDLADSILHEFVHASLHQRGVDLPTRQEERVATVLGGDLLELITRNPELIAWLTKGCK